MENIDVYRNKEFNVWSKRNLVVPVENYLFEKYLNSKLNTLEAGTGTGRIAFELKKKKFEKIYAYDYLDKFIKIAKANDPAEFIKFSVLNATSLNYEDESFQQIIYLTQMLSFMESTEDCEEAIKESNRVLKSGGIAIFSFNSFEARRGDILFKCALCYINIFRIFNRSNRGNQFLPWFKQGGKLNLGFFGDKSPYVYWFKEKQVYNLLERNGFYIIESGYSWGLKNVKCLFEKGKGPLYVVCKKI